VSLSDKDASVVDRLGQTGLEDLGLEATLHEVVDLQAEHVIEFGLALIENTETMKTSNQSRTLEKSLGVFLVQSEKLTCEGASLGEQVLHSPDLFLVAESVLANNLHLSVHALLFEATTRDLEGLACCA
jgi:hypothetical protein